MKKWAVMTVKWDVGAPAGFRGDAPAPCWADCQELSAVTWLQ